MISEGVKRRPGLKGSLLLSLSMLVVVFGTLGFLLVQHGIEESRPRQFPAIAYTNTFEYFWITGVFLVGSFIGGCGAVRVVKAGERLLGGLLLFVFTIWFLASAFDSWKGYQKHTKYVNKPSVKVSR